VEVQRHSPVAKQASAAKDVASASKEVPPAKDASPGIKEVPPAKDASPVVSTAKADTKKSKHYKPKVLAYKLKVLARQRNNYHYGNALGYAQEYGYGPRAPFFQ
jgi:hypothetical protein